MCESGASRRPDPWCKSDSWAGFAPATTMALRSTSDQRSARPCWAALALRTGAVVSVSRLVELVWGDDPPRTAEKTLQSYITRLRKGLGAGSIAREGAAYRLTVDPRAVDVARFQRLLDTGDVEAALAEWSGRPMAGLDAAGLGPAVDGLVEQWLGAVEAGLAHHVARLACSATSKPPAS